MRVTVEIPKDWAPRRELMNDLKKLGDAAHGRARGVQERIVVAEGLVPNPSQEAAMVYVKRERVLGDALHALATEIERA